MSTDHALLVPAGTGCAGDPCTTPLPESLPARAIDAVLVMCGARVSIQRSYYQGSVEATVAHHTSKQSAFHREQLGQELVMTADVAGLERPA